jgi:hypothetical protein
MHANAWSRSIEHQSSSKLIECPRCGYKGEGWLDGAQTTCMAIKPFPPCKCTYVIEMQDGHWKLIGTCPAS